MISRSVVSNKLAYRDNGRYVLPPAAVVSPDLPALFHNIRKVDSIGPHQTLIIRQGLVRSRRGGDCAKCSPFR